MPLLADDPLIAAMVISDPLPLHESSRRLRELNPASPRVYGVASMADVGRRRWWPLASAARGDRLRRMLNDSMREVDARSATSQLAATLAYTVVGRVVALVVLEGRAWDPGLENLWVHNDSEGAIDWAGVVDPRLRVLPDDPAADGVVRLPSEAALATWTAHRCHRALQPLFGQLHTASRGIVSVPAMWGMVGAAVITIATQVPLLAGSCETSGMRRAQAVLDAFVRFDLPVRGPVRTRGPVARADRRRVDTAVWPLHQCPTSARDSTANLV